MNNVATPFNILSLCSGVGMLDVGLHEGFGFSLGVNARTVGYVERDAYAAAVLLARMAGKELEPAPVWCGNLESVDWSQWAGAVDCIAAGFPCQPHSMAGSRKGTDDARWIWPAITECIRLVRPGFILLENVSGLRSSGGMAPVLADLAALGFRIEWDSIRASDVDASHQRERVFILGFSERSRWTAPWSGPIQYSGSESESGCSEVDDSASSRHYRTRTRPNSISESRECVLGSGCESLGHANVVRHRRQGDCCIENRVDSSSCEVGHTGLQHQHPQQRTDGAEHQGAGDEMADTGCQRERRIQYQRRSSRCASNDKHDGAVMADTSQPRPEGRDSLVHILRTDGFTI